MNSKTLDEKLRNAAIKANSKRIRDLSYPLTRALNIQGSSHKIKIKTTNGDIVEVNDKGAIEAIISAGIERQSDSVGDMAVNEFIKKVDSLQDEINAVYENIG